MIVWFGCGSYDVWLSDSACTHAPTHTHARIHSSGLTGWMGQELLLTKCIYFLFYLGFYWATVGFTGTQPSPRARQELIKSHSDRLTFIFTYSHTYMYIVHTHSRDTQKTILAILKNFDSPKTRSKPNEVCMWFIYLIILCSYTHTS